MRASGRPLIAAALLLQLLQLLRHGPVARAAHAASHHEVFLQHAWHRFEERGDWSDWEETWRRHDHDKDGNIRVNVGEITRLFKEHYNILHDKLEHDQKPELRSINHGRATDASFHREAQQFIKLREEMTGHGHREAPMSWKVRAQRYSSPLPSPRALGPARGASC